METPRLIAVVEPPQRVSTTAQTAEGSESLVARIMEWYETESKALVRWIKAMHRGRILVRAAHIRESKSEMFSAQPSSHGGSLERVERALFVASFGNDLVKQPDQYRGH